MTTVVEEVQSVEARHVLQVYKRLPIVLVRGDGSRVVDAEGREYIDLLSGIGSRGVGARAPGARACDRGAGAKSCFIHPICSSTSCRARWRHA